VRHPAHPGAEGQRDLKHRVVGGLPRPARSAGHSELYRRDAVRRQCRPSVGLISAATKRGLPSLDSGSMGTMSWKAYLEGHSFDLGLLVEQFDRGQVLVRCDGNQYWMESPDFDALTEPGEVQRVAGKLLSEMNGAATLVDASFRTVELTNGFSDGPGSNIVLLTGAIAVRSRFATATAEVRGPDGELIPPPPAPPTLGPDYLAVALHDGNVREVLDLLGGGPGDWVTLYKIYEIIRDDGHHTRWAPESDYRALTASANLPSVSGSDARHARGSIGSPKRTMTIHDARAFIRRVALAWVSSK
jgi:hypothetical protein